MNLPRHLIIFVKEPRLGKVKKRLAADIGSVDACSFYRRNLKSLLNRLGRDPRWHCWLSVTPDKAARAHGVWPSAIPVIAQGNGDMGQRMHRAMCVPPCGPVALVGGDVPGISPAHIAATFKALGHHDAVFGPAEDGGFWLVGMKRRPNMPYLYSHVRWSGEHVLADTLKNLPQGFTAALGEILYDVDNGADYNTWKRLLF